MKVIRSTKRLQNSSFLDLEAFLRHPSSPHGPRSPLLRRHRQGSSLRRGAEAGGVPDVRVAQADHRANPALLEQRHRAADQGRKEDSGANVVELYFLRRFVKNKLERLFLAGYFRLV